MPSDKPRALLILLEVLIDPMVNSLKLRNVSGDPGSLSVVVEEVPAAAIEPFVPSDGVIGNMVKAVPAVSAVTVTSVPLVASAVTVAPKFELIWDATWAATVPPVLVRVMLCGLLLMLTENLSPVTPVVVLTAPTEPVPVTRLTESENDVPSDPPVTVMMLAAAEAESVASASMSAAICLFRRE